MSTENEGQGPERDPGSAYGPEYADPTAQFDAFRARQAEERRQQQQETQTAYSFPPEYAADPDAAFVPPMPPMPPMPGGGDGGRASKTRSLLIFGGVVLVVCVMAVGAWLAFGSSSPSTNTASANSPATAASPTGAATDPAKRALTFRVTIASLSSNSFTGTAPANGDSVTVTITSKTRFGTKTHAFSQSDLTVGETVIVRGRRTGTDTITATEVAANVASS
jgi:Domain of unknown function (DUF5666)